MQSDIAINNSIMRRYFMPSHNSKGYSRYYHTINKMYDEVLRAWSRDAKACNSFGHYQDHLAKDIRSHAGNFIKAMFVLARSDSWGGYPAEFDLSAAISKMKRDRNRANLAALVKLEKHEPALRRVYAVLTTLIKDDPAALLALTGDPEKLDSLSRDIDTIIKDVPHHMAAILKEVRYPVNQLRDHLRERSGYREKLPQDAGTLFREAGKLPPRSRP